MKLSQAHAQRGRAYSLVELLFVFAIIAVILSFLGTRFFDVERTSTEARYHAELRQLSTSFSMYHQSRGFWPTTIGELEDLEPGFSWTIGEAVLAEQISAQQGTVGGDLWFGLSLLTEDGSCLFIANPPKRSGLDQTTGRASSGSGVPCSGQHALTFTGQQW